MKKKLVVFDLDGTLNRTELFSVPAHLKALENRGIRHITAQEIISLFGERAEDCIFKLVGTKDEQVIRSYLDEVAVYEKENIKTMGKPYDGVLDSLKKLRADGYLTAVCSNASLRYISLVLDSLGLMPLIDYIQELRPGMDKVQTLGLLLDKVKPDQAVMVGDRRFDIIAGKENGLQTIGCRYGFGPEEAELADEKIDSATAIYKAVKKLI